MTKNRMRFYIVLAIVFVLISVIAFAVPIEHGPCFWLSYVFAVIAIAVIIALVIIVIWMFRYAKKRK